MGVAVTYMCPKCGYEFTYNDGVGMMYPYFFAECQEEAKMGKFGGTLEMLFFQHPDGIIDPTRKLYQCDKCGRYYCRQALDFYIPNGKERPSGESTWTTAFPPVDESMYVDPDEFEEYFTLFKKYNHFCGHCRGHLHEMSEEEYKRGFTCPVCHHRMKRGPELCWD